MRPGTETGKDGEGTVRRVDRGREAPLKTPSLTENHYREWTQACKTGSRTDCPIEFG
jgi:hypothetical protein